MKKKRTISIKNPKLQKFRNNLRSLLLDYGYDEIERLRKIYNTTNDENMQGILMDKRIEVDRIIRASICQCASCSKSVSDMTFNPHLKEWFCAQCYKESHEFYKNTKDEYVFP